MTDCTPSVARLFDQMLTLPAMKPAVQELIASFSNDDIATGYIASRIASDPVLSARLLRLANSAAFSVSGSVATVEAAMTVLGFVNVRTLVISIALTGCFEKVHSINKKQFWQHSLRTALIARFLAKQAGLDAELAYFIGLMHALGELVMQMAIPELMVKIEQNTNWLNLGRASFEQETLGYSYAEVGAELLHRWHFPEIFSHTIAQVVYQRTDNNPLAGLVQLAILHAMKIDAIEHHTDFMDNIPCMDALQTLPDGLFDGIQELMP